MDERWPAKPFALSFFGSFFLWARQGELKLASREDALGRKEKNEHTVP
jgi:hypothetical protein